MKKKAFYFASAATLAALSVGIWNNLHAQPVKNITNGTRLANEQQISDINVETALALTNTERKNAGVKPLTIDPRLSRSAQNKCNDLVARNYYSHNGPDGKTPWHFITEQGINNVAMAENIDRNVDSAQNLITDWLNSPGHKANIDSAKYNLVGFGVCKSADYTGQGPQVIVVQHFTN